MWINRSSVNNVADSNITLKFHYSRNDDTYDRWHLWVWEDTAAVGYIIHEEYHVDGFRFDLAGILDVETVNEIVRRVREMDPSIILYGEGWNMSTISTKSGTKFAIQTSAAQTRGGAIIRNSLSEEEIKDLKEYYQGLILFRKEHKALRMNTRDEIAENIEEEVSDRILIVFNPNHYSVEMLLPEGVWNICVNGEKAGLDVIESINGTITLDAISAYMLIQ